MAYAADQEDTALVIYWLVLLFSQSAGIKSQASHLLAITLPLNYIPIPPLLFLFLRRRTKIVTEP